MNLELEQAQAVKEQRFLLSNVTWEQYETLRSLLDESHSGLHMFYLQGNLELFMPSDEHEGVKKTLARLLELYVLEVNLRVYGLGSTTYRKQAKERGLEPDECYCIGSIKEVPDIAIEVIITSGLLDKLEIYRGLEVPEVWVWRKGNLIIHRLREDQYEQISQSEFLPELDLELLTQCVMIPDQHDAVMAFRDALRSQ
ncbi:Uma2 family endonuclease [Phormidesmis sp. 146-33]